MTAPKTQSTALGAELNDFLLELGLALQRFSMYPGGHPSVDATVARLEGKVEALLREREMLSMGVARRQLVIEGVATESSHPVLRTVAERLHRHRIGAVVFRRGLVESELLSALREVARDPDREGRPVGAWSAVERGIWPHVRFHPVTYEQLQLAEHEEDDGDGDGAGTGAVGTAVSQLWLGLARAAMAKGAAGEEEEEQQQEVAGADPEEVASAINVHAGAEAYDQVILGYMLQLAEELKQEGGASTAVVRKRVSRVVRKLEPATLQGLLRMGGDVSQRARFLHSMARGLRADAVLELTRAAAHSQGESISTSMLRLLRKLTTAADLAGDTARASGYAEEQMREQVRDLLTDWSLHDPNPKAYTNALEAMARDVSDPEEGGPGRTGAEPLRVIQMGLELEVTGPAFWRAVDALLLVAGGAVKLYETLNDAPQPNATADAVWQYLETGEFLRRGLTTDPVDFEVLDAVLQRMDDGAVVSLLLDRLSESESRATRMGAFRRIAGRPAAGVPQVVERLGDPRWYVRRNMIALLDEIDTWPENFSALAFAADEEARVRREAYQLATRMPAEREAALCLALGDTDERAIRIGINTAREQGLFPAAEKIVLQRLADEELSSDVRVALIRLLGRTTSPYATEKLLSLVVRGRSLFGRPRLMARSPELVAALATLAARTVRTDRVEAVLERAGRSSDPQIRAAVQAT